MKEVRVLYSDVVRNPLLATEPEWYVIFEAENDKCRQFCSRRLYRLSGDHFVYDGHCEVLWVQYRLTWAE